MSFFLSLGEVAIARIVNVMVSQLFTWHGLEHPGKRVSRMDYVDQGVRWACPGELY